jgi:acetyltransferase
MLPQGGLPMNTLDHMKLFLEPRSIALIGVSRSAEGAFFNPFGDLLHYGFPGKVYPVNPSADSIMGRKVYASAKDLPEEVDLAVILTPRATVPGVVKECVDAGIKAIIVVAQGFADSDEEGKRLQAQIVRTAGEAGARIIGPNTFGTANAFLNLCTALFRIEIERTPVGIISQTGLAFCGTSRFRFGKVVDLGDACDLDVADALEYFEDDSETKAVVLHIEGLHDGASFREVASRVARKKPVLALKSGRCERAAEVAQSHTGSLTGRDEVYEAAFKQSGVIRVEDLEEMEDLSLAFWRLPPMKGRRMAIMAWAGSTAVFAVDACEKYGLQVPDLSAEASSKLRQLSPPSWFPLGNPVDIWSTVGLQGFDPRDFKSAFRTMMEAMLASPWADALLVTIPDFLYLYPTEEWDISPEVAEIVQRIQDRPVAFSLFGPTGPLTAKLEAIDRVIVYPSCERALRAMAKMGQYHEWLADQGISE